MKPKLLFLAHRIPYPPNKGDKIRSFNILKKLTKTYDIYLGCFIDDIEDHQYVANLSKYCVSVYYLDQNKTYSKLRGLSGFFTGKPITLPYYFDIKMQQWVDQMLQTFNIDKVFVYSSSMAQYCENPKRKSIERIIDFVDIDSDKWRQYAQLKKGIAKWFYNREYRLLADYEDHICQSFNHSFFVSPDEANLFKSRQHESHKIKIHSVLNGVDTNFFDPNITFSEEPLVPTTPYICFTGAMDYWANIDAVMWFITNVWPLILSENPRVIFCIVGGNPPAHLLALNKKNNIVVTGRVKDIRPFIAKAQCVVAPLQIARGIQNKVLEAMSLNKPIVVTKMAMEGINANAEYGVDIVDAPECYANCCLSYFSHQQVDTKPTVNSRAWIINNFTWQQTLKSLNQFFRLQEH